MNDLEIRNVPYKGRGVFALKDFFPGDTIEVCPAIELTEEEAAICQKTMLSNYLFDWYDRYKSAVILGYGSLYNHSYTPNCKYIFHEKELTLEIVALTRIRPNEEICFNYNGDPADTSPLDDMEDVLTGKKMEVR